MNQEKIGKFIVELRKEKKLTQQELADKLGVTDRAVSHWENGRRLPDYSLLKDISTELSVSINELLSGERLSEQELKQKADENIIKFSELISFKSMKYGVIGMCFIFIILVLISTYKDISPAPLVSLICAYNSVTFISRYKLNNERSNLVPGVMFGIAMVLNTIAFVLN
ncbi:MAG: helix-turn-helix transcriptional regulator [Bacilli bacterium]|nr:helix-turn-helix transcriptional regulator [Bacilli bacterium]